MMRTFQGDESEAGYCDSGTEKVKSRRLRDVVVSEDFYGLTGGKDGHLW
jgi:hypothetical protein